MFQNSLYREKIIVVGAVCKSHSHNGFVLTLQQVHHVFYARNSIECEIWIDALREASTFRLERFYDVRNVIGTGGFAEVRAAYDRVTKAKVAVKTIDKSGNTDAFLQREISIMRKVRHPNIVQTLDIFESVNRYHIVMEFLSGGSLFDLMKTRNRFPENEVRHLVQQVLLGLSYIHSLGIVHRDLKPENILLCGHPPYCAKIADFGLSNFHDDCSDVLMKTLIGTPQFVAPELVKNEAYGSEVDAWAVGVIAFNMLTGSLPFSEEEVLAKYKSGNFTIEYHSSKWRNITDLARSFTRMLLCTDASRRLNTVGALRHKWFIEDEPENHEKEHACHSSEVTALMRFRKCVHAMRFLKRVLAKAGLVTTFKVEQLIIPRQEDVICPLPSNSSVGTADESEWDYVVQDFDRLASRLDNGDAVSPSPSPRGEACLLSITSRGMTNQPLPLSPSSLQPCSNNHSGGAMASNSYGLFSPISPVPNCSRMGSTANSGARARLMLRAESMNTNRVHPSGSVGAAIRLDRANTAIADGRVRQVYSMAPDLGLANSCTDSHAFLSNRKNLMPMMSELPSMQSSACVQEMSPTAFSPTTDHNWDRNNCTLTGGAAFVSVERGRGDDVDRQDAKGRKREKVRNMTRRILGGLRGSSKNRNVGS